ncbi:UNVERIFIED_CONTAM: hypothetical protein NCL1_24535 [Trichonephila clavipes]
MNASNNEAIPEVDFAKFKKVNHQSSNSVAKQTMRARAYCAHPSIRDHWVLRCMGRCPDPVVSLKRDPIV